MKKVKREGWMCRLCCKWTESDICPHCLVPASWAVERTNEFMFIEDTERIILY